MGAAAGLDAHSGEKLGQTIKHRHTVECFGPDGELRWREEYFNLTTTAGLNKYLDATLKTGSASPGWYVGLVDGASAPTFNAADVMNSHAGWSENTTYSNSTRPAWTPGSISAGSVDNSASKAVFNINGSATIAGCFMVDSSTKGGTSGTLLGEGVFSGGSRAVQNGDTLNVTITATQT